MANNSTYNFLDSGVNWLPLFTRTAVTGEPGSAGNLEYTFGTEAPTSFDGGFDLGTTPTGGIEQNWGRYDQAGIKRNNTGITNTNGAINPNINESSIFINNISPFTVKVWQYVGDTFSEAGITSTSTGDENVGYWISHSNNVEPGTQQHIPWQNDRYGFQTERIYFQALDNDNVLDGFNSSELNTIEEISIAQDFSAATGNTGSVTADNIYGIMVVAKEGIYSTSLFNASDTYRSLILSASDDEHENSLGLIAGEFWKKDPDVYDTFLPAMGLDAAINIYREPNVTKGFILIDTNISGLDNFVVAPTSLTNTQSYSIMQYHVPSSYTIDVDGTMTTYNISVSNITDISMYYTIETSGVLSGVVEGSFLTGSVVQGKDINGVLMTATTNSSGYYEFPRAAFGEIVAKGGTNLITGEEYTDTAIGDDNVDAVTEDLTTNSIMGGTISPVSTLLHELQKNEGYSQEEALDVLVNEGQELYDLDSSIANESKLREYLKIGLTGLQNSETDDLADYTNFLMFSKKIAEQEQLFVDTNINGDAQKSKKKQAANSYRKSLTRFIKRKQDDNVAKFKTDYLAKAGTDSTASAIGSTPTKKDQFYLILADAVEKVDPLLSSTDKLASSKADFKVKAKEMMEETIDDQESISTSGKDYEDIALEVNEKFFKRKQAAKEEQVSRYNGNAKVNFSTRKSQNTFTITKETDGYKRSGDIIKKTGASSTTLSSTAKTRTAFLKDDNVEKFNPISVVGDSEVKLKKSSTGRLSGLSRFEQAELSRQTSTGVEVRNPNHIIVEPSANGFSAYSVAYAFHASEGVSYKSRGLGNQVEVYSFAIVDQSTGKRVKTNYANDSLFRQLADAFMTLANADTVNELTDTVVYYYLNEFALRRDSDMDGVIDSEDAFPNDPTKFEHTPFTYTIDTTLAGDSLTQRFGTGLYNHSQTSAKLDLDNENIKIKIDWGEGAGWEYYGKSDSVQGRSLHNTQRYNFEHAYAAHGTYQIRVSYEDVITAYPTALTQPVPQGIGAWVYGISSTDWAKRVTSVDSWGDMNTIRLFTAQGLYNYLENCQSWPAVDTSLITEVAAGTYGTPFIATTMGGILHTAKYVTSFNASDWNLTQGKGNKVTETSRYYNRFKDADRLETLNLNGLEYDKYSSAWPDDHGYFGSLVPNGTLVGFNDITIDQDGGTYNSLPNNAGGFAGYLKGRIHKDSTFNNMSINNTMDDIWRANPTNNSDIITDDSTYTFQQKNWIDTSGENRKLKVKNLPSFYLKGTNGEARTSGIDITVDLTSPNGWELHGSMLRQWQYGPQSSTLAAGTNLTILGTGNWDTSNVTNWYQFMYAVPNTIILDMDISSWSFDASPTDAVNSFSLPTLKSEQYTKALIAWAASEPSYSATINLGNAQYDYSAHAARTSLVNDYGWTITDGGNLPRPFKFTTELPEGQTDFQIQPQMSGSEVKINWGDGNTEIITGATVHTYSGQGPYEISIDPEYNGSTFEGFTGWNRTYVTTTVNTILQWGDVKWENNYWFNLPSHSSPTFRLHVPAGAENAPDLSRVTSLARLFSGPGKGSTRFEDLYNNIETWDVSTITDMSNAFQTSTLLSTKSDGEANVLNLSAWDVSKVENFGSMFYGAAYTANGSYTNNIGVNVTGWDTSSATNMSYMFTNKGIKTGYGNFNTSNVTNMTRMFGYSTNIDEDFNTKMVDGILRWDVSKVTSFNQFLYGANLSNLSSFNENYFPKNWRLNPTADFTMNTAFRDVYFTPATFTDEEAFATKTITQDWYGGSSYTAWDMSNCSDLGTAFFAFLSGHAYNPKIDTWNITSKMTNMHRIFGETSPYRSGMTGIDRDISGWDFSGLVANGFDYWSGNPNVGGYVSSQLKFSNENYDALLLSLDSQELNITNLYMGSSQYTGGSAAETAKNSLIAKGITITDGGVAVADADGDGVNDNNDLYPNDNTKTTQEISGTLQFTDLGSFDSTSGIVGVSAIPSNLRQNLQYAENDASTPSSYKIYNGDDKDTADYITWDGAAIKNSDSTLNLIDAEEVAYVQAAEFLTNATFENYFAAIGGTGTTSTDYVGSHYMWKSTNPEAATGDAGIEKILSSTLISATGETPTATEAWEWGMKPVELWANEFIDFYSNNGFGEMNYVHAQMSRFRGNTDYTDTSNQNISTMTGSWIESLLHYSIASVYNNTDLKNSIWTKGYLTYSEYESLRISGTYANTMLQSLKRVAAHGVAKRDITDRDFVGPRGTEAYTNSEEISMTSTLQDIFTNQAAVDSWISTIGGASTAAKVCTMYDIIIGNGILEVAKNATDKANYENVMLNGYGNIDKMKQALSYSFISLPVEQNNYLHSYPNVAPFLNGGSLYKDLNARTAVEYISKFQYVVNWMIRVNDAVPASGGSYGGVVGDDNL